MENELSNEKTMTVKELADNLHVSDKTIRRAIISLNGTLDSTDLGYIHTENGISIQLTEVQCTAIKLKLRERNNLKDNSIVEQIGNDLEFFALQKKMDEEHKILDIYRDRRISELEEQNRAQSAKLIEQKPKVEVYDAICDSSTLQDLQTVAQTIGVKNIFKLLVADGIIQKAWTEDGTMFYKPYAEYNDYLILKDGGTYLVNNVPHIRPRIFVTGKGLTWITKKYKDAQ
jgi:phage antirepressor YoqD-like protein